MDISEIRNRLDLIENCRDDFERASILEKELFRDFVASVIIDSHDDLRTKAKLVLTSLDIDFFRLRS